MKRLNTELIVAGILVVLVLFFAVFAYFDWVVGLWVNNPYVDTPERSSWNLTYWTALGIAMLMVGVSGAVIVKLVSPGRIGTKFSVAIFFSTVVMIVGNLEDWLFFIVIQRTIPPLDTNMNWLFQASLNNGYWFAWQLAVWSIVWLFAVLPLGLVAIFKYPFKR